jgi:hypothetical protein
MLDWRWSTLSPVRIFDTGTTLSCGSISLSSLGSVEVGNRGRNRVLGGIGLPRVCLAILLRTRARNPGSSPHLTPRQQYISR